MSTRWCSTSRIRSSSRPRPAAGDTDLQARNIRFDNYTVLKEAEERKQKFWVRLWDDGRGSKLALYPESDHQR